MGSNDSYVNEFRSLKRDSQSYGAAVWQHGKLWGDVWWLWGIMGRLRGSMGRDRTLQVITCAYGVTIECYGSAPQIYGALWGSTHTQSMPP